MTESEREALIAQLVASLAIVTEIATELGEEFNLIGDANSRARTDLALLHEEQAKQADWLAKLVGEEPPPPPPPDGEPSPAIAQNLRLAASGESLTHEFMPGSFVGPGKLVVGFYAEADTSLSIVRAADGAGVPLNACSQALNGQNVARLFWRDLLAGETLDRVVITLDKPDYVLGLGRWQPGIGGSLMVNQVSGAGPATDVGTTVAPPAGSYVIALVSDHSNTAPVWTAPRCLEKLDEVATTTSGGFNGALGEWLGWPGGSQDVRWKCASQRSRIVLAVAAWDVGAAARPFQDEPPPPPPPPSGDSLEKTDSNAEQIGIKSGEDRAPILRYGAGLGSPGGQSSADQVKRSVAAASGLITEFRLNTGSTDYVAACKAAAGVVGFHMTHYGWQPANANGSAKAAVDGVARLLDAGVTVTSFSGQNEPRIADYTDDQLRAMPTAMAEELDRRSLGKIKVVTFEVANCDTPSLRGPQAWASQVPGQAQCLGHHSYGFGISEWFLAPWRGKGGWGRQYEAGYLSWSSALAKLLSDLRFDQVWCAHRLHQTDPTSDPSQNLFDNACKPYPWTLGLFAVWRLFPPGTVMLETIRTGASGDAAAMHQLKTYKAPLYARLGRLKGGGFGLAALAYSGGRKQITVEVPGAKAGQWTGQRLTSDGKATPFAVDGIAGKVRCIVGPGELVTLSGGG